MKYYLPLISVIILFLVVTYIVSPFGNYPVNDDWDFYLHVKYFNENNFVKNSLIDASFILQGFIGLGWVKFFGLNFVSLRFLTIFFTLLFFTILFLTLKFLNINSRIIFLILFCVFAEPFLVFSAYSFMTEVYFLFFVVLSFYFFIRFKNPYPAILIAFLSCFIRQFGYVLLFSYALYFYKYNKNNKFILITILGGILAFLGNYIFPAYTGHHDTVLDKLMSLFGNLYDFIEKLFLLPKLIPYIVFTSLPLIYSIKFQPKFNKLWFYLLTFTLGVYLFYTDIFDLKNVFHIECYLCETDYRHSTSIFNNIPFKIFLSCLLAYGSVKLGYLLYNIRKENLINKIIESKLIVLLFFMSISTLAILASDSFYDRYFMVFSVLFVIIIGFIFQNNINLNWISGSVITLNIAIITLLNIDFHSSMATRWSLGEELNQKTGLKAQIYVTGTFNKFYNAVSKSPEELLGPIKYGVQKCFVLRHIISTNNPVENFLDSKIFNNKYLVNPKFSNASDPNNLPSSKEGLSNLINYKEYNSPIYNLIGRKTYFVSFCTPEITQKYNIQTSSFPQ